MTSPTFSMSESDRTLRTRDAFEEPAPSSGHTLAGFPTGNLPATERARDGRS